MFSSSPILTAATENTKIAVSKILAVIWHRRGLGEFILQIYLPSAKFQSTRWTETWLKKFFMIRTRPSLQHHITPGTLFQETLKLSYPACTTGWWNLKPELRWASWLSLSNSGPVYVITDFPLKHQIPDSCYNRQ